MYQQIHWVFCVCDVVQFQGCPVGKGGASDKRGSAVYGVNTTLAGCGLGLLLETLRDIHNVGCVIMVVQWGFCVYIGFPH